MRHKRLLGIANTLCHMVDGDGRYRDDDRLAALGSGVLVIDALTGISSHNGRAIEPPLFLAERIHKWLPAELDHSNMSVSDLSRAAVTVTYSVQRVVHNGRPLLELGFQAESEVATKDRIYHGTHIPGRPVFGASVQC